jgi:uncharacterized membrane protein
MPDPCRDHPRPLSAKLTMEEQERLDALEQPWPRKFFAYIGWLCAAMPEATGTILFTSLILGGIALVASIITWLIILAISGWAWIPALVAGILLGIVARAILRDAAATELRIRQSIREKQRKEPR